ncbi:MAG: flagellar motor protein MotB [Chitinispirillales bacterium]|jgi:chemotaxis protein MotB|nr:flagellar motor protein MotB [Chitinispirillales bacterium]
MAREKKCPPCKQIVPEFMATYGDMVTLILCFFVLLFALMVPDAKKFELAASSFQSAFNGVLTSLPTIAIHQEVFTPRLGGDAQNKHIAADAARKIKEVAAKENMEEAIKVNVTDTGIAIRISDKVSFDVGSDRLKPEFVAILEKMMAIIRETPGREIRVEGHTDNTPINTARFPSNWELSSSRALSVVKYLYQRGEDPKKLSAVGYGEFRPIFPNDTEAHKRENRRIEVYVEYLEKVNK